VQQLGRVGISDSMAGIGLGIDTLHGDIRFAIESEVRSAEGVAVGAGGDIPELQQLLSDLDCECE